MRVLRPASGVPVEAARSTRDAVALERARVPSWWGTLLVVLTDATIFALLLASYFFIRLGSSAWPPDGIEPPSLLRPVIGTVLLLASSWPIFLAERRIRRGDAVGTCWMLGIALLLELAFIVVQALEYADKTFTPRTDVYGSLFFTITGFHGAHVIVAILAGAVLEVRAWLGHFTATRYQAVQNVALYWHFVGLAWIFIFASLYLTPHLGAVR